MVVEVTILWGSEAHSDKVFHRVGLFGTGTGSRVTFRVEALNLGSGVTRFTGLSWVRSAFL